MIPYKQLSLADFFTDCQNKFHNNKYEFLSILDETINLDDFDVVPDASKFTRFKQDFLLDLQSMFDHLVDLTEPICQRIDWEKASMTLFDTSGIEAWVTENNPKYANRIIKQLKSFKKANSLDGSFDPYKAACGSMPSHAAANPTIQQMYINGHFCYAFKFGIVTNGLGIVRHISFYNKGFLESHPETIVGKKADSPDEDKSLADSKALVPTLKDFFRKHPLINPKTFLGDAAFDSIGIYKYLLQETSFEKAYIPLKNKLRAEGIDYTVNDDGIPCCPHDASLPVKRGGSKSHLCCGLPTMKFVCPKMKWEWDSTYKVRVNVEKSINHFKDSFCVAGRKTRNEKTLHADLLLAGITQLITVMVADKLHKHQYIRSLKPLIA